MAARKPRKQRARGTAQNEAQLAVAALRTTSSWVCAQPKSADDRVRLLPRRSTAPGRGRAGTSAALNQ